MYHDSKVHGANMGPIWGRQDPGGPHVGPMNLTISVSASCGILWDAITCQCPIYMVLLAKSPYVAGRNKRNLIYLRLHPYDNRTTSTADKILVWFSSVIDLPHKSGDDHIKISLLCYFLIDSLDYSSNIGVCVLLLMIIQYWPVHCYQIGTQLINQKLNNTNHKAFLSISYNTRLHYLHC